MATTIFGAGALAAINKAASTSTAIFGQTGTAGIVLSLFVNNKVPAVGDTLSMYQAPTTSLVPTVQNLVGQTFVEGLNSSGQNINLFSSEGTFSVVSTPTSGVETTYGYVLQSGGATPTLIFASTFNTPIPLASAGQIVAFTIQPSISNNASGN
jgi:hypothetical protein